MSEKMILASQSRARFNMLRGAGIDFTVMAPTVDEAALQAKMIDSLTAPDLMANALAQAKALSIVHQHPDHLVIGGDQVMTLNGKVFTKAVDEADARAKLHALSGQQHEFVSAVCVGFKDRIIWHHVEHAKVTLRTLDDKTLDAYCRQAGDALTRSVGAYELEGLGPWLMERVEGDYFTILGMPLLPLLHFLRSRGFGI